MIDEGGSPFILGVDEVVLGIDEVANLAVSDLGEKKLFLEAQLGQLDALDRDVVTPFGQFEGTPVVVNLQSRTRSTFSSCCRSRRSLVMMAAR